MTPPETKPIPKLHDSWNRATGQHIPLGVCSYAIEHGWHQFIKAGHTEAEMLLVVAYLQAEIKKGERRPAALRWSNCIGDTLRFSEELELATGAQRQRPPLTPRERVVSALRHTRPTPGMNDPKHVSELIANLKAAAGMQGV